MNFISGTYIAVGDYNNSGLLGTEDKLCCKNIQKWLFINIKTRDGHLTSHLVDMKGVRSGNVWSCRLLLRLEVSQHGFGVRYFERIGAEVLDGCAALDEKFLDLVVVDDH